MYRAITLFTDLQDGNYKYNPGDEYPRVGLKPSKSRINELLTSNNRRKKPMIEKVEEVAEPIEEVAQPVEEVEQPIEEQPKPRKRKSKAKVEPEEE